MSRRIKISDSTFAALEAAASAAGVTPEEYVDQLLTSPRSNGGSEPFADMPVEASASDAGADEDAAPGTLYERMKHLIGVVSSDLTDGSERHSEYFAEGMLQKYGEGRL